MHLKTSDFSEEVGQHVRPHFLLQLQEDVHHDQGVQGGIVDLVLAEGASCPVGQRLFFADLSAEDFLADVGEVAVLFLWVDGLEELASIDHVAELKDLALWSWQAET